MRTFSEKRNRTALVTGALGCALACAGAPWSTGCSDEGTKETPAPTGENPDLLQLGAVLSLTGASADIGSEAQNGLLVAEAQINGIGGILGKQVKFVVEDDQSDPQVAVTKMSGLVSQGMALGIGPSTSDSAQALSSMILGGTALLISPSATAQSLDNLGGDAGTTNGGPVLFRTAPSDAYLAAAIAQYATGSANDSTRCPIVDIIYQQDDYGTPIAADVAKLYRRLAYQVNAQIAMDPNMASSGNFDDVAARVASSAGSGTGSGDVACQIVIAEPTLADAYMLAFRTHIAAAAATQRDWTTFLTIGSDGFRQDSFLSNGYANPAQPAGATAGEGSFAVAADTTPTTDDATFTPDYAAFLELYQAHFPGQTPGTFAATAYDAAILLAAAMDHAGTSTNVAAVRSMLFTITSGTTQEGVHDLVGLFQALREGKSISYSGASGPCAFEQGSGDVLTNFGVWNIASSAFKNVQAFKPSELSGTLQLFD